MLMESHINCNPFVLQANTLCGIDKPMFDLISNVRGIFSNHCGNKSTIVGFDTLVQEYSRHDKTLIQSIIFFDYIKSTSAVDKQIEVCSMKLGESSQPHMEEYDIHTPLISIESNSVSIHELP
jgi:hypothetical protein